MEESLMSQLVQLTGLSEETLKGTLKDWALEQGQSPKHLTIETLRELLCKILQDVTCEINQAD